MVNIEFTIFLKEFETKDVKEEKIIYSYVIFTKIDSERF